MISTLILSRTPYAAALLAMTMFTHASTAATAMTELICRGTTMQNACKQQEICIDDPRRLSSDFGFSLSLTKQTYVMGDAIGRIVSVEEGRAGIRKLRIDPAIHGGTVLEFSADDEKAKLVGGDYNYIFQCQRTRR